jgi:glycosyltransferase involved in cell wall biosynthesis
MRSGITVIFHERNAGKGAAIRTGLAYVSGEVVIVQEADLEYSPDDYPALLAPILAGHADVVYGSRFLSGPHRVLFFWHSVANSLLTLLSNMLSDLNQTDMETGFKVFRTSVLNGVHLQWDRFGFEPEITAKISRQGCRIYEVPISYHGRDYAAGKKITWRDGVTTYFELTQSILSRGVHGFNFQPETVLPPGFPAIMAALCVVVGCQVRAREPHGVFGSALSLHEHARAPAGVAPRRAMHRSRRKTRGNH